MEVGIKNSLSFTVDKNMTAKAAGSGTLDVLATPVLCAFMEKCAWESVSEYLADGESTVGSLIELSHLSPTPIGGTVKIDSVLEEIDRKKLTFTLTATDDAGIIGKAKHERFIISIDRFMDKANSKIS